MHACYCLFQVVVVFCHLPWGGGGRGVKSARGETLKRGRKNVLKKKTSLFGGGCGGEGWAG